MCQDSGCLILTGDGEVPPVLASEGVVVQLGQRVVPALRVKQSEKESKVIVTQVLFSTYSVAVIVVGVLAPSNVDLGVIEVLAAVVTTTLKGAIGSVEGVLDIAPVEGAIARVLRQKELAGGPV